jgi:hypothetical protein
LPGAQVGADQIVVTPVGGEKDAKAVHSDLDKGIEQNLDAALIRNKMHDNVKYAVKSGVVTDQRSELGRQAGARREGGDQGAERSASVERSAS